MPDTGYLNIEPGQHKRLTEEQLTVHLSDTNSDVQTVSRVINDLQTGKQDAFQVYMSQQDATVYHDSGSPWSFHSKRFRKSLKGRNKPHLLCQRFIRARGFFDNQNGRPPMAEMVNVYEFALRLEPNGKWYQVISHELPDYSNNCRTLLVGRGSLQANRWELRYDDDKLPYIGGPNGEKSYTMEAPALMVAGLWDINPEIPEIPPAPYEIGRAHV